MCLSKRVSLVRSSIAKKIIKLIPQCNRTNWRYTGSDSDPFVKLRTNTRENGTVRVCVDRKLLRFHTIIPGQVQELDCPAQARTMDIIGVDSI